MRFNAPRHSYESKAPFATEVKASVRFFDADRGFGFVTPEGGGADAFLPARLVEAAGRNHLPEGATLTVDLTEGDRGPQVSRIYRFDLSTATERDRQGRGEHRSGGDRAQRPDRSARPGRPERGDRFERGDRVPRPDRAERGPRPRADLRGDDVPPVATGTVEGTVKWYDVKKGFGFIAPQDGGKDIFVHASALARSGLSGLAENARVRLGVREGQKGREAVSVEEV
jgi:cold shock protein